MAVYYLWSGSGAAEFVQSNAYSSGQKMVPKLSDAGSNYTIARRWVWECTTAGTSAAAEPTWPASVTQDVTTVTSGTAVFTARKPGFSSGTTENWNFASIYALYIQSNLVGNADDVVYIASDHNELAVYNNYYNIGTWNTTWISVNRSVAPPTTYEPGAVIAHQPSGGYSLSLASSGASAYYGIHFKSGVGGAQNAPLNANAGTILVDCTLEIASTMATLGIAGGGSRWYNTKVKFAVASQGLSSFPHYWVGGGLASGGTQPDRFTIVNAATTFRAVDALDLTGAKATMSFFYTVSNTLGAIRNTKMPTSWSGSLTDYASPYSHHDALLKNVGETDADNNFDFRQQGGSIIDETTLVVAGRDFSYRVATPSSAVFPGLSFDIREQYIWCATAGVPVTLTYDLLRDSVTNLTDKDVVLEVVYPNVSGNVFASMASSAPDFFATATDLSASAASWTTTGMSNPNAQKVSVTFTPTRAGMLVACLRFYDDSTTIYVDPKPTVT